MVQRPDPARRRFLVGALPAGALACLGCTNACGVSPAAAAADGAEEGHKFDADSQMSYAELFNFAFRSAYIPILQALRDQLGREDYVDLLKQAGEAAGRVGGKNWAQAAPTNDFSSFKASLLQPQSFLQARARLEGDRETQIGLSKSRSQSACGPRRSATPRRPTSATPRSATRTMRSLRPTTRRCGWSGPRP